MNTILVTVVSPLIGPLAGIIAHNLFDHIDDYQKWTDKLPNWAKQTLVVILATAIPVLNAKFGLSIPADPTQLLNEPAMQGVIATAIAFLLKGAKKKAA